MRKKSFFLFAVLLAGSLALPCLAQRKRDAKDSTVVIIFNESGSSASKKRKAAGEDNIVKIAPLGFISGSFPLLYERRINDFLTVEVGGGLTHRNYIRGAYRKESGVDFKDYPWDLSSSRYDEADPIFNFDHRTPEIGYMFRVMPRIYFESDAPEGNYIGFLYDFSKYKFSIPAYRNGSGTSGHTGAARSEYEDITDLMVYFGRQWLYDRISVESSFGIGLRNVNGQKYVASTSGGTLVDGMAGYKQSLINFGLGLTVGYHF